MANKLLEKIKKNSTISDSAVLAGSKFFDKKDMIQTEIPAMNIAFCGDPNGGFSPGLHLWAGPSKHFKTAFTLMMIRSYQRKYKDGVVLFYDSEFGTPKSYFESFGIDMERVLHSPLTDIEVMKFDIMAQLQEVERGDRLMICCDSVGNLASKKEVQDAIDQKSVSDMTRAKQIKSLFRMVTPHLNIKDIPMVVVMHVYMTQEMYSKPVVSGGCLTEGTKIQLADGSLKPINNLVVGEMVKTKLGPKEITEVWNPNTLETGEPDCFEIEFEDGYKVVCSDEHRFLVNDRWVEAKNLKINMEVSAE